MPASHMALVRQGEQEEQEVQLKLKDRHTERLSDPVIESSAQTEVSVTVKV